MIVYLLYCTESKKGYVGQTTYTLEHRWQEHVADARLKRACCRALEAAIRKYGEAAFEKTILQECQTLDELNIAEELYIQQQNTLAPRGYNLTAGGYNHQPSKESRAKMSASGKGRIFSDEHRRKLSESNRRRKQWVRSEEYRAKVGEVHRGNKYRLGHKHSEETLALLSESHKNSPRVQEHMKKVNALNAARREERKEEPVCQSALPN